MMTDEPQHIKDKFSFVTGAVRRKDLVYATVQDDTRQEPEDAHFYLVVWHQGSWMHVKGWSWPSVAVEISLTPAVQVAVLGPLGEVLLNGSNDGRARGTGVVWQRFATDAGNSARHAKH